MSQVIVIPDLHGRSDLLHAAISIFEKAHFVVLGDAIDRGPNSIETVQTLLALRKEGRATLLMGNHERMAQEGFFQYEKYTQTRDIENYRMALEGFGFWMQAGGSAVQREIGSLTLESFPEILKTYLRDLPRIAYINAKGEVLSEPPNEPSVMIAHGSPPVKHKRFSDPMSALLWLGPNDGPFSLPSNVVYSLHGHTTVSTPTRVGRHVYIDLGAYATGKLAVAEIGNPEDLPKIHLICGSGESRATSRYLRIGSPLEFQMLNMQGEII